MLTTHTKLGCDLQQQSRAKRTAVVTNAYQFDVSVRPYTLRKGDTLKSIAQKRGKQRCCRHPHPCPWCKHIPLPPPFAAPDTSQQRCACSMALLMDLDARSAVLTAIIPMALQQSLLLSSTVLFEVTTQPGLLVYCRTHCCIASHLFF
jgi:hypothetical protein